MSIFTCYFEYVGLFKIDVNSDKTQDDRCQVDRNVIINLAVVM